MSEFLEYLFRIVGPKPDTIPMSRLALYMGEFARLMGSQDEVHFAHIVEKSVGIVARAREEDVATISPRIRSASRGDDDADAASPWRRLNELLAEDRWTAELPLPKGGEVIIFPGSAKVSKAALTINQHTSVQGRLVRIEGSGDTVKVGLDIDGDLTARITVSAAHAKELAHLFHQYVRLGGEARWKRDPSGRWTIDNLNATTFEVLEDAPLSETLAKLKAILPAGSGERIVKAVNELRSA